VPLAHIRRSPEEFSRRFNLSFETFGDDREKFELAAVALVSGSQVWLERHRGDSIRGTLAHVDAQANLRAAREELKDTLQLTDDDFIWISPLLASSEPGDSTPRASTGT
jgi:hypothetical protein